MNSISPPFSCSGQIVDLWKREIYPGTVYVKEGHIDQIVRTADAPPHYILPGFVDAHIHIESSMLVPSEFARIALTHGTIATVSDPHEIANVMGLEGVYFMMENGETVPLKFFFGAPSCVPATAFETAGAILDAEAVEELLQHPDILYLAEMMNFPGVLHEDAEVMAKIALAHKYGKPVDGHAPGLRGEAAKQYISAGISTDHECVSLAEAEEKLLLGMKILIREGSAAKNFAALIPLLAKYPEQIMFCSDDKHPDELLLSHINGLVSRAIREGYECFDVLRAASLNPVEHYGLDVGLLRTGDKADFIVVTDLEAFEVQETYVNGEKVAANGTALFHPQPATPLNQFQARPLSAETLKVARTGTHIRVIEAINGSLLTQSYMHPLPEQGEWVEADLDADILKLVVVNRYQAQKPALAFINNMGLQDGAIASCVGHDSHNIIAVGTSDAALSRAINLIIEHQGGISAVSSETEKVLPLPVAGIMSTLPAEAVGTAYSELDQMAKAMGSTLDAPFMTLSFMALLVIPALKLSDQGLFDGERFQFVSLQK